MLLLLLVFLLGVSFVRFQSMRAVADEKLNVSAFRKGAVKEGAGDEEGTIGAVGDPKGRNFWSFR